MSTDDDVRRLAELEARLRKITKEMSPIHKRLARVGLHDHIHGSGTYEDPSRWHAHSFEDGRHEHEPRGPDDAPWPNE